MQLEGEESGSVVVIRGLRCGVLFVAVAGSVASPAEGEGQPLDHEPLASPGETESILSQAAAASIASHTTSGSGVGGMSTAAVLAVRRQTEELARWLDDRLGSLSVPEDCVGGGWGVR